MKCFPGLQSSINTHTVLHSSCMHECVLMFAGDGRHREIRTVDKSGAREEPSWENRILWRARFRGIKEVQQWHPRRMNLERKAQQDKGPRGSWAGRNKAKTEWNELKKQGSKMAVGVKKWRWIEDSSIAAGMRRKGGSVFLCLHLKHAYISEMHKHLLPWHLASTLPCFHWDYFW